MPKRNPDFHAQTKLWTPYGTMTARGNAPFCIAQMFGQMEHAMREKLLGRLEEIHKGVGVKNDQQS